MREIHETILFFFIYSFLGWIFESIYCSIGNKKIINRGFLNGPICPIYGFGALIIIFFLKNFQGNIILLFIFGALITSTLEYITGIILENLFNTTWWDYSKKRFNIKGRVCLKNSILFGVMSVVLIEVIHKNIYNLVVDISDLLLIVVVISILVCFFIDLNFTVLSLNKLNRKLKFMDEILLELSKLNINLDKFDEENIKKLFSHIKNKNIVNKIESIKEKSTCQRRIIKAFPNMKHKYKQDRLVYLKQIIKDKKSGKLK
ncbi:putative ABC transporter permease [[Clostridium] dakarense]|uniref:putative ABC transporter permease n=1 Tax=Faecalimicrobium dakarense TaxID=1301100 RepID=UPI0004AEA04C|nr:putative ABC transporter permease [[Clostridium] dakarense]